MSNKFPNLSYWEKESFFKDIDIVIIGSGLVGLSAAIHSKTLRPKAKVVVLERGSLPIGASTRNAGFACFGSVTELLDDLKTMSKQEVFHLVEKRWAGLQRLRARIGDKALRYQNYSAFELFRPSEDALFQECKAYLPTLNEKISAITGMRDTYRIEDEKIATFGFSNIQHLICNQAEGQIHTGEMMKNLLAIAVEKGIHIYNGVEVENIEESAGQVEIHTNQKWVIQTSKVLVATNGFARSLLPKMEVHPARNQVLITKPIENLKIQGCFHYDKGYYYFRNIDNRILLGGGRNLALVAEATDSFGTSTLIQDALTRMLEEVILPDTKFEIDSWWSGILGVGDYKKPIVQNISDRIAVAVRMGGMGVAIGSLIGEEGAELIV